MHNHSEIEVKICGLSDPHAVNTAVEGGAHYIGFVFFEKSPRNVAPQMAAELSAPVRNKIICVAVSVNADDKQLDDIVGTMSPHMLQLHGNEPPQRVQKIKKRYGLPIIKAFPVRHSSDFQSVDQYAGIVDHLLFDAKPSANSSLPGGNGIAFDWNLVAKWHKRKEFSWIMIAGGMNPDNLCRALQTSKADAVDVSSGVEKAPGVNDTALIASFLKQTGNLNNRKKNP